MTLRQFVVVVVLITPVSFLIPFTYYSVIAHLRKRGYHKALQQGRGSVHPDPPMEKQRPLQKFAADMALRQRINSELGDILRKAKLGEGFTKQVLDSDLPNEIVLEMLLQHLNSLKQEKDLLGAENTRLKELLSKFVPQPNQNHMVE